MIRSLVDGGQERSQGLRRTRAWLRALILLVLFQHPVFFFIFWAIFGTHLATLALLFVGAFGIVALGDLDRIASITKADKFDPLHHTSALHIQAGDDSLCQHQRPPAATRTASARSICPS